MAVIATMTSAPEFWQLVVNQVLTGANLRLGCITTAGAVSSTLHYTDRAAVIAAEYNAGGWARPNLVIPSVGAYNSSSNKWELTASQQWLINFGTSFDIKQLFVILGGSTIPRDTTGTLIGLATLSTAITVPASTDTPISAPWLLGNF